MEHYLAKRRKELGKTQKEVADFVGVTEATVSRWESGNIANMRRDKIKKYAVILETTPSAIMGIEDSEGDRIGQLSNEVNLLQQANERIVQKMNDFYVSVYSLLGEKAPAFDGHIEHYRDAESFFSAQDAASETLISHIEDFLKSASDDEKAAFLSKFEELTRTSWPPLP